MDQVYVIFRVENFFSMTFSQIYILVKVSQLVFLLLSITYYSKGLKLFVSNFSAMRMGKKKYINII